MKQLMSASDFAFYLGYVDTSQGRADEERRGVVLESLKKKVAPVAGELERVLATFGSSGAAGGSLLPRHDLVAGCAAVGVVLSDKELEALAPLMDAGHAAGAAGPAGGGAVFDYKLFCAIFKD